jgi:cytochrome c oxidase subunit 2
MTACSGPYSTLNPAGPAAADAAALWWGMSSFAVLVLLVVVGLWLYALRRRPGQISQEQARRIQNRWIIGGGLLLPITSMGVLLAFGIPIGHRMLPLPVAGQDVLRIEVTGHQWWWQVEYPQQGVELRNELHIPAGQPVDLHLTSNDVIHSFWVPRLGGKLDMLPGRTNVLRLQAHEPGIYHGQCAEFCGTGHAHMQFTVHAHAPADFAAWLESADDSQ